MTLPIYRAEREAGLEKQLLESLSIACYAKALPNAAEAEKYTLSGSVLDRAISAVTKQIDLYYMKDIMVSAGWNLNDDVFIPPELYAAKDTVADKQFNLGHDQNKIIGHQTSSYLIDADDNVLADDLVVEDLPDKFHLVSTSVIYKWWPDKDQMEAMAKTIEEIEAGKWYVSMECLFPSFDYALVNMDTSEASIVSRNKETAFLTKHLRRYGGTGSFQNYKVGRVLRDIVFSGKGLVEEPANPNSVILNQTEAFKVSYSEKNNPFLRSVGYISVTDTSKEKIEMTVEEIQKELDAKKSELAVAEAKAKEVQANLDKSIATASELAKKLEDSEAKVKANEIAAAALNATIADVNKKLEEKTAEVATVATKLTEVQAVVATFEQEKVVASRELAVKTRLKLDDAKAKEYVATLAGLTEEAFAKYLDVVAPVVAATETKPEVKTEPPSGSAKADVTVLETAEVVTEPVLAVASENTVDKTRLNISSAIAGVLLKKPAQAAK